ncbi:hypothetical protein PVAP13_4KG043033 [Panicum virgatum]|uniref:Uncharacterized protein n=1 Tax=Panicum virgatum TaxID=38727 RepID=A0A8T0TGY8_PANVG|nr:hypothetical protein PVAP13_4KG043033 [Panicum virgatum]
MRRVTSVSPYCFSTRRRGARHAHVSARGARAAAGSNGHVAPSRQQSQTERALTHVVHMAWTRCLLPVVHGVSTRDGISPIPLSGRTPNASETDCQDGALKRQGWLCHGGAVGRRKSQARRSKAAGSRQAGGRHGCSRLSGRQGGRKEEFVQDFRSGGCRRERPAPVSPFA